MRCTNFTNVRFTMLIISITFWLTVFNANRDRVNTNASIEQLKFSGFVHALENRELQEITKEEEEALKEEEKLQKEFEKLRQECEKDPEKTSCPPTIAPTTSPSISPRPTTAAPTFQPTVPPTPSPTLSPTTPAPTPPTITRQLPKLQFDVLVRNDQNDGADISSSATSVTTLLEGKDQFVEYFHDFWMEILDAIPSISLSSLLNDDTTATTTSFTKSTPGLAIIQSLDITTVNITGRPLSLESSEQLSKTSGGILWNEILMIVEGTIDLSLVDNGSTERSKMEQQQQEEDNQDESVLDEVIATIEDEIEHHTTVYFSFWGTAPMEEHFQEIDSSSSSSSSSNGDGTTDSSSESQSIVIASAYVNGVQVVENDVEIFENGNDAVTVIKDDEDDDDEDDSSSTSIRFVATTANIVARLILIVGVVATSTFS